MILASDRRRSRLNRWLVGAIALLAFGTGGMVTLGAMKVASFFDSDDAVVAETNVVPIETDVTRTAPTPMLQVTDDIETPEPVIAEVIAAPASPPEIAPAPVLAAIAEPIALKRPVARRVLFAPIEQTSDLRPQLREATALPVKVPAADVATPIAVPLATPLVSTPSQELQVLTQATIDGTYDLLAEDRGDHTRLALYFRDAEPVAELLRKKLELAARAGSVSPDFATIADTGEVDTQTLIFEMVQNELSTRDTDGIRAARGLRQKAFAASDARTSIVAGKRVYTVRPGDSIAYIALQFYGNTQSAAQILSANLGVLTDAGDLKVGMQLVIPNA